MKTTAHQYETVEPDVLRYAYRFWRTCAYDASRHGSARAYGEASRHVETIERIADRRSIDLLATETVR